MESEVDRAWNTPFLSKIFALPIITSPSLPNNARPYFPCFSRHYPRRLLFLPSFVRLSASLLRDPVSLFCAMPLGSTPVLRALAPHSFSLCSLSWNTNSLLDLHYSLHVAPFSSPSVAKERIKFRNEQAFSDILPIFAINRPPRGGAANELMSKSSQTSCTIMLTSESVYVTGARRVLKLSPIYV